MSSKTRAAVILAGGFGTRLRGVLKNLPKPMAPVEGRPFVEWIVRFLRRLEIRRIALSTGYLAGTISGHFNAGPVPDTEVICIPEESPLGTAGGFLHTVRGSKITADCWLVCNGDSLLIADLAPLFAVLDQADTDAAVFSVWMEDASRYGSLDFEADGQLIGFREKRTGSAWINAGIYLFRTGLLQEFPKRNPLSFESDVFPDLISRGCRIKVVRAEGDFLDIGLPESLSQAEDFICRNMPHFW